MDAKIVSVKNIVLKIYVLLNSLVILGTSPHPPKKKKKGSTNIYLGAIKTLLKLKIKHKYEKYLFFTIQKLAKSFNRLGKFSAK